MSRPDRHTQDLTNGAGSRIPNGNPPSGHHSDPIPVPSDSEDEGEFADEDANFFDGEDVEDVDMFADEDENYFGDDTGDSNTLSNDSGDSPGKCFICQEEFDDPRDRPHEPGVNHQPFMLHNCLHDFGHFCLNTFFQDIKKPGWWPMCPKCRTPVVDEDIKALAR